MKKRKSKKKENFLSLLSILSDIDDPRNDKGKRHPLPSILALLIIGFLCGLKGYTPIATWARRQKKLTDKLGFTHDTTPCAATFHNILKRIDVDELEKAFTKWISQYVERCDDLASIFDAVAIDGKTMRASEKGGAAKPMALSVVSHELGVTLTQIGVSSKTNEIPGSTEILKNFDVSGKVITADALLTQKTFCREVIERGGDYVLTVKRNQRNLFDAIKELFQAVPDTTSEEIIHPILKEPIYAHRTDEKSHGRLETRRIKASESLNAYLEWPGVEQVLQFRYTSKNLKSGEKTDSVYYGMTSLSHEEASAEHLLAIKRGHWSIENKSHYLRDTQLGEDASPVRCGDIPQVMAAFRNTALSVLRLSGITRVTEEIAFLASRPLLAAKMIM